MIIVLKPKAKKKDADEILKQISSAGLKPLYLPGTERTVLGAIGDERILENLHLDNHPLVDRIDPILTLYKMVSREIHPKDSIVKIGSLPIGGKKCALIAGPCAIESKPQLLATARAVKESGGHCLRGGAYKPRSSPYSFQGLGVEGLKLLKEASQKHDLPTVTEVIEVADIEYVESYADAFQVGARNMQNFRLLKELGQSKKPVILKRGMSAKLEELLLAAEYIVAEGNPNVILCERGIRTFETAFRNTLDLNAVPYLKKRTHLPVIVDPSHGTGLKELVLPMARAAIACGADGLMIEVHNKPKVALSDGKQSLSPKEFRTFVQNLKPFISAVNKTV